MRDFEKEISAVSPKIMLLDKVVNGRTKVKCRCLIDGYEWETRPYDLLRGFGCHACKGVIRYTTETFKKKIEDVDSCVNVLSEYKNARTKIKWECKKCKSINLTTPNDFLNGVRCKTCAIKENHLKQIKNTEWFKAKVNKEYEVLGEYEGTEIKINLLHKKCGFLFDMAPHNFLSGQRCPKCNGGVRKKDDDYFRAEVEKVSSKEYEFIGNYKGIRKEVAFKHIKCGNEFKTTPTSFLHQGTRCPDCFSISKGELEVKRILDEMNVGYVQQKTFDDLKDKRKLRFDFFLPAFNSCIEYDGQQHFVANEHWGGLIELKATQKRDAIKNEYCKDKNIKLLRISYLEKNIANKIEGFLDV